MSSPHLPEKPIPMGILVTPSSKPTKAERPTPKPRRSGESGERQIPWLYIAIGGSALWVFAIVVIAICARANNEPTPVNPGPIAGINNPGGAELNPNGPKFIPPAVDEFRDPAPRVEPPKLVRKGSPKQDDMPPPLALDEFPEGPEVIAPVVAPNIAPEVPNRPRPNIDLNLFADCQQIGTDIRFYREPPEAFKEARKQKKIVFMVHLSGNLEDKDFT